MPSFETPNPIVASIELSQGTVQVIASDRTDTVIAVNPTDRDRREDIEAAQKIVVDHSDATLSITGPKPRGFAVLGWGRGGSVDVTVELPEGSSLRSDIGAGDFRCHGRIGDVYVKTGAGSVRMDKTGTLRVHIGAGRFILEESSGNVEVKTAGDITIGSVRGSVEVKNGTGKTTIDSVGGIVQVKSANGEVTIGDAGSDLTVKTSNGDIRIGEVARGSATIETAFGGLDIGIKEGTAAWIDANTKFGQVRNTLSPTENPDKKSEVVEVRARTGFGDVLIARSKSQTRQEDI
jgi:DUF4097 and DUF4098 domain-containing protein YvlB